MPCKCEWSEKSGNALESDSVYMRRWNGSQLAMVWCQTGDRLLPEQMMMPYCVLDSHDIFLWNLKHKTKWKQKYNWKCYLSVGLFSSGLVGRKHVCAPTAKNHGRDTWCAEWIGRNWISPFSMSKSSFLVCFVVCPRSYWLEQQYFIHFTMSGRTANA